MGLDSRHWQMYPMDMATPGELNAITAKVLGLPEAHVFSTYRALREAGLVTKSGRGPAAAKMTARDAATLLTAILGSNQIVESAATVRRYSNTNPTEHTSTETLHQETQIEPLATLPRNHSFLDALTALVVAAADGKLLPALGRDNVWNSVRVVVRTPMTSAKMDITGRRRGTGSNVRYTGPSPSHVTDYIGDMEGYRVVSTRTFLYIGALLAGKLDELPALTGEAA